MKGRICNFGATLALIAISTTIALAAPQGKKPSPKKAAPATCPVCHMFLSKTATSKMPVAIHGAHGTVMYCCTKCKMPASALVHKGGSKMGKMARHA